MGFPPAAVDGMSLWEFTACIDGWNKSQGAEEKPEAMSGERLDELLVEFG